MQSQIQNQEAIKAAVRRMCEHLGSKGVDVKHAVMLEAIAEGLGAETWRKLKAIIDAPRNLAKTLPPVGVCQRWTVNALYLDNNQQYGGYVEARTPLEAAIFAIVERLADHALEIGILDVRDAAEKCHLSPDYVDGIKMETNRAALKRLCDAVLSCGEDNLPERAKAQRWLLSLLDTYKNDDFDELTDYLSLETASKPDRPDVICKGSILTPAEALGLLCDRVEDRAGGVVQLEKDDEDLASALHHVRAMCIYFADVLNSEGAGGIANLEVAN